MYPQAHKSLAILGIAAASFAPTGTASADTLERTVCGANNLLLRNTVIIDASGRWDDQDILIEQGEVSAIGTDLDVEIASGVPEIEMTGAVVRPRRDDTVQLFVRTSTAPRQDATSDYIMPGQAADLTVYTAETLDSTVALDIRAGRIQHTQSVCVTG